MSEIVVSETNLSVTTVDASNTYLVENDGGLYIYGGGVVSGLITVDFGALFVSSGGTALSATISDNGGESVDGGIAGSTTISDGDQSVEEGGIASGTTIGNDGYQLVEYGGTASCTTISSGGQQLVEYGGIASGTTISYGGS